MFCLHIYFNFLHKASWTNNLFYFLSIFKSLQVTIQASFSSSFANFLHSIFYYYIKLLIETTIMKVVKH